MRHVQFLVTSRRALSWFWSMLNIRSIMSHYARQLKISYETLRLSTTHMSVQNRATFVLSDEGITHNIYHKKMKVLWLGPLWTRMQILYIWNKILNMNIIQCFFSLVIRALMRHLYWRGYCAFAAGSCLPGGRSCSTQIKFFWVADEMTENILILEINSQMFPRTPCSGLILP